jgi:hypothetical protein
MTSRNSPELFDGTGARGLSLHKNQLEHDWSNTGAAEGAPLQSPLKGYDWSNASLDPKLSGAGVE